jgi:hypothetical protein
VTDSHSGTGEDLGLVAVIREFVVEEVGFDGGDAMTDQAERLAMRIQGSLRSRASGTPAITPETATAIYLAVRMREVQRATFEGGRITTADIADVFREHGVEVTS